MYNAVLYSEKTKTLARKIYNVYSINYLSLVVLCKIIVFMKDIIFLFAVNGMIENIHINSIFCVIFLIIFCQKLVVLCHLLFNK